MLDTGRTKRDIEDKLQRFFTDFCLDKMGEKTKHMKNLQAFFGIAFTGDHTYVAIICEKWSLFTTLQLNRFHSSRLCCRV